MKYKNMPIIKKRKVALKSSPLMCRWPQTLTVLIAQKTTKAIQSWTESMAKATKTAALWWHCLWYKQQQKYEGVGYVKLGRHVENVFKQMNYWKKKSWGKPVH